MSKFLRKKFENLISVKIIFFVHFNEIDFFSNSHGRIRGLWIIYEYPINHRCFSVTQQGYYIQDVRVPCTLYLGSSYDLEPPELLIFILRKNFLGNAISGKFFVFKYPLKIS